LDHVEWFGLGPGEAYRDSRAAARVGRFDLPIEELQTPYLFPQENGNRSDVRWARIVDGAGRGLRIDGGDTDHGGSGGGGRSGGGPEGSARGRFELTVRRWTTEDLDRATNRCQLAAGPDVVVNLDAAINGLGTESCGPGVLPDHQLPAGRVHRAIGFSPEGAVGD
jgi:beta-galactosidase